jgi:peptide/nickel transport system permease protein
MNGHLIRIAKRLLQMLFIMIVLSVALFGLMLAMPGNPVDLLITSNPSVKPEDVARLKKLRGLDKPWYIQYFRWMYGYYDTDYKKFNEGFVFFFTGNKQALGFSYTYKRPVYELLLGRISNTLQLMIPALLLSFILAIPLGIFSAYKQYSYWDYLINFMAFIGISLPVFWFGIMMIYVFSELFSILPAGGIQTPGMYDQSFWAVFTDRLKYAILPTIVLSIVYVGRWLRYMRSSMLEVLPADYIRTARAKGLREWVVIYKHAFRNALIPVITILALSIPQVFDYYVAIVVFLISATLVMLGNLLADILYTLIDPRMSKK